MKKIILVIFFLIIAGASFFALKQGTNLSHFLGLQKSQATDSHGCPWCAPWSNYFNCCYSRISGGGGDSPCVDPSFICPSSSPSTNKITFSGEITLPAGNDDPENKKLLGGTSVTVKKSNDANLATVNASYNSQNNQVTYSVSVSKTNDNIYKFTVAKDGFFNTYDQLTAASSATTITRNFTLKPSRILVRGYVVDKESSVGIPEANIKITLRQNESSDGYGLGETQKSGKFEVLVNTSSLLESISYPTSGSMYIYPSNYWYYDTTLKFPITYAGSPIQDVGKIVLEKIQTCSNVKNVRFCWNGTEAGDWKEDPGLQPLWTGLADKINSLKTETQLQDKNFEINIDSGLDGGRADLGGSIHLGTTLISGHDNDITFTSGVLTHEFGHEFMNYNSNIESFWYELYGRFAYKPKSDPIWVPVTDGTYSSVNNLGGNPSKWFKELFASTFYIMDYHKSDFAAKINTETNPDYKKWYKDIYNDHVSTWLGGTPLVYLKDLVFDTH